MRLVVLRLWFLLVVRPVTRLLIGLAVFGRGHLPRSGPAIVIANHNSHLDAAVLMSLFPLRTLPAVRPIAAADFFNRGPVRRWIATCCMNAVLIERCRVTRSTNPLPAMLREIDQGHVLIVFPEGTRGTPERMAALKTGVAHLIVERPEVPVIAVFMRNLGFNLPRGEVVLVPMFCDVFIAPPRRIRGARPDIMHELSAMFTKLAERAERMRSAAVPDDDR